MFEIHQKKVASGNTVWPQASSFQIDYELLFTQNVSVARFARNVECDFFYDFQTLWDQCLWSYLLSGLVIWFLSSSLLLWWLLASFALPINNTWLLKEWRKLRSKSSDLWSCNFHRQVTLQRMGKTYFPNRIDYESFDGVDIITLNNFELSSCLFTRFSSLHFDSFHSVFPLRGDDWKGFHFFSFFFSISPLLLLLHVARSRFFSASFSSTSCYSTIRHHHQNAIYYTIVESRTSVYVSTRQLD